MSDSATADETIAVSRSNPPEIDFNELPAKKLLEKGDLPKKRKRWEEVKLPVDALLLTVKDCEFLSCVSYLNSGFFRSNHITLGDVYFGEIGDGTKVALKVCEMGSSGPGGSAVAVQNAVKVLKPKVVFFVGFCGGLNERKLKLGDVVVLTKLMAYGPAKVTEGKPEYRGVRVVLDRDFLSMVQSAAHGWKAPLTTTDERKSVTVHNGPFLTGSQVVDSKKRRDELTKEFSDALAIEMEAEGLYQAAHDLKIEWGVIKGVSDFADGRKSNTDSWRPFASVMAASLTAHILDDPVIFQGWKNFESPEEKKQRRGTSTLASKKRKLDK